MPISNASATGSSDASTFAVTFHGVRGSTPCHGSDILRYGGNTSCVSLNVPGADPIVFDMGTGLRYFGAGRPAGAAYRGTFLLSHLHWDHIQGLPFFPPMLDPDTRMTLCAPAPADGQTLSRAMSSIIREPVFPVGLDAFAACPELLGLGAEAVLDVGRGGLHADVSMALLANDARDHSGPMDRETMDRVLTHPIESFLLALDAGLDTAGRARAIPVAVRAVRPSG